VFQRPLPYLYLARQVFGDGRLPYQAIDALPLSGEPFAATVDIVFSFIASEGNRASLVELLQSPHLSFAVDVSRRDAASLDEWLREVEYAGGWERLQELGRSTGRPQRKFARALERACEAALALRSVVTAGTASGQLGQLLDFLLRFERLPSADAEWAGRHLRARSAILSVLDSLRDAHARHDDAPLDPIELAGGVRRWIEAQTFAPRTGAEGIRLLDGASAPYAEVDELRLLGLVERDWPEPANRSIFYPASMLSSMGWPADASRMAASRARFQDLLTSAGVRVSASVFTLEDDAIVPGSPLLEEIESARLPVERWPSPAPGTVFLHEMIETGAAPEGTPAAAWLEQRRQRTREDDRFKGFTGPRAPRTYAISYVERYLDCPFKYFASQVLKLPEERDEEAGLTPIERGHFIHEVFETFFKEWQAAGQGTITTANVADALELFESVALRKLEGLPQADRALERTHLLGSAAASGLAERAFAFEIEQGGQVVERLLEHVLEGTYTFAAADGERRIRIKAKADRIDLMADGTLRIIDYKLGRAPKLSRSLQLPIYGVIAQQELEGYKGRSWKVANAGYVAFKEKEAFVPLGGRTSALDAAIAEGQQRLLTAIGGIERGEFPVQPDEPFRCQWCGYAGVCRKDYVGDE
jgi:RecB family exonuclease